MAPSMRDVQLTEVAGDGAGEEVRLLDSYDEEEEKLGENLRRIQVRVTGMTCAACSNSVEGALMSINGVVKATVALLQNKADVIFDPSLVKLCFMNSSRSPKRDFEIKMDMSNFWGDVHQDQ